MTSMTSITSTIRENTRILRKERLEPFLESLLQDRLLFAPVRKGEMLLFERIKSVREAVLGQRNTKNSTKGAFFPQTEKLFAYRHDKEGLAIEAASTEEEERLLFGIHPCDARAHLLLDRVFGGSTEDPYYAEKRRRALVVSVACTHPDAACFCLALGGGPCSREGSDLLLIDLGDRYLVEAASEKGRLLLEDKSFEDADEESFGKAEKIQQAAESLMQPAALWEGAAAGGLEKRLDALFDDPLWKDLTESCLSCGICTYLCPTCHCFDICDEAGSVTGERIRIWDSCQFPLFTRQASGHNPRPSAKERFRQRIMHKFSYLPRNVNMTGCVGCGRCVTECPVNLDFREVLLALSKNGAT
jgi:sulfhydrogenase subunit beta (sulfur reductase)